MDSILKKNYFELFGLENNFELDTAQLQARYRELQRVLHPDRYASSSDREKRIAIQQAALVNEAYRTLKIPVERAKYMLKLENIELNEQGTTNDEAFLMEQMEMREAVEEARTSSEPQASIMHLMQDIEQKLRHCSSELANHLANRNFDEAKHAVYKMQFIDKLHSEVQALEDELSFNVDD
jgi:molecular chaperone HscB